MVLAPCYVNILLKAHLQSFPKVSERINWKRSGSGAMANEECSRIAEMQTHGFTDAVYRRIYEW